MDDAGPVQPRLRRHRHPAALVALALAMLLTPAIGWGVYLAVRSNANDVRDWLPAEYSETRQFRWFVERFGVQDAVVATWPGCVDGDPRLARFTAEVRARAAEAPASGWIARVVTGEEILRQLTAPPIDLPPAEAVARLQGSLVGPDGRQTCAVVTLREEAANRLDEVLKTVARAAAAAGIAPPELKLGGVPVINAAINRESADTLVRLACLSAVLGVIIAWLCFRNIRLTLLVLAVGVYSAALSLAFVAAAGVPLNAVLMTMAPLVYVTALSGAIHLTNYYREAVGEGAGAAAAGHALRRAALPLVLAMTTTAFGLLSLAYSELYPIRLFGVFSAIGVLLSFGVQVAFLPAALALLRPLAGQRPGQASPLGHGGLRLPKVLVARPGLVAFACLAAALGAAMGLPRIETSIQMMRLFSPQAEIIPTTRWLEEHLGATIPLECVLRFAPHHASTLVERMQLTAAVEARLRTLPHVGGSLSAATFAPRELDGARRANPLRRGALESLLRRRLPQLERAGYLARHEGEEDWRISLQASGTDDIDFAAFNARIAGEVDRILDASLGPRRAGVELVCTGTAPIVFHARRSLLDGMLFGLATDVVLIVVAVAVVMQSPAAAGVMFLLGVFPTTVVFGLMGLAGVVVDIGSVMTPCVAVGVTVDDVVHFMLCFRRGMRAGMTQAEAVAAAYGECARPMVQSWGIIGVGLSAFALSSFVPTFRFGMLMLLLVSVGLVGNLLLLPALLLLKPIGRRVARVAMQPAAAPATERPVEEPATQPV